MADSSRLMLTDEGNTVVRGEHEGAVLVSVVDSSGRVEPFPLPMLADRVELAGGVPAWAVKGASVAIAEVPEEVRKVLEQVNGRLKRADLGETKVQELLGELEEKAQEANAARMKGTEVELAAGEVIMGQSLKPWDSGWGMWVLCAGSGFSLGVMGIGLVVVSSVSGNLDILTWSIPWTVGAWVFAHAVLGVHFLWQTLKFWQPVKSKKGKKSPGGRYLFRVCPGGQVEIRAKRGIRGREEWRPAEEFAAVAFAEVGREVKVKQVAPGEGDSAEA